MILIDEGQGSSSLLSHPPLDTLGVLCRLPSPPFSEARADIAFTGCGPDPSTPILIGIEVKEETELADALETGRLQATQLPALMHLYDVRWLLVITGTRRRNPQTGTLQHLKSVQIAGKRERVWVDWAPSNRRPVQYDYVSNFLCSPSFTQYRDAQGEGVRHHLVYDKAEAAHWIGQRYLSWQRPYASHTSMRVLDRSGNQNGLTEAQVRARLEALHDPRIADPRFVQRVRTASSLPGVSYDRAIRLAEWFGSVQEMVSPMCTCAEGESEEERVVREREEERKWREVPGIGKGIAGNFGKAVR